MTAFEIIRQKSYHKLNTGKSQRRYNARADGYGSAENAGLIIREDTMRNWNEEAEKIMIERFGKDTVIALATAENEIPYVRYVNAYFENGAFFIITYALSNKMKQLENNSTIAIAGEWFTAHGKGINLGWFGSEENRTIAEKLKKVFSEWIDNGHNNFDDENTIILRVELTDALLLSHGTRYEL